MQESKNWGALAARRGGVTVAILVAIEVLTRMIVGSPPLYIYDEVISHMRRPNQSIAYAGSRFEFNAYGMRSAPVDPKAGSGVLRYLVLGDDVVEGGVYVDQDETVTSVLERRLTAVGQNAEVLNIAAPGWGPGHMNGYIRKFGTFNANLAAVVLSTSDLVDDRVFGSVDQLTFPLRSPTWVSLFILRRAIWGGDDERRSSATGDAKSSLPELLRMLEQKTGAPPCVVVHANLLEVASGGSPQLDELLRVLGTTNAVTVHDVDLQQTSNYATREMLDAPGTLALADAIQQCPGFQ